jgi:hypothetical protein
MAFDWKTCESVFSHSTCESLRDFAVQYPLYSIVDDWLKPAANLAIVSAIGWLITRWRQWRWQREFRGATIALIALTVAMVLLSSHPNKPLATPASQATPATSISKESEYRNQLSLLQTTNLTYRLSKLFEQNRPLVFVITAPLGSGAFELDFNVLIREACQRAGNSACMILYPLDPNHAADTGIPEPQYPGIVIHTLGVRPLGTMLSQLLGGAYIVRTSEHIPEQIRVRNPTKVENGLVWFELGKGNPSLR